MDPIVPNPYAPQERLKPSIRLYQPVKLGAAYSTDITQYAVGYRQAIRLYGGNWTATWSMEMGAAAMKSFFKQKIGYHTQVYSGGTQVWEGLIWSMDLTYNGVIRRISLDKVRNSIMCIYTDVTDDERKETSWYKDDHSIARYGEIQEIVYLDKTTTEAAEAYAQTVLIEGSTPLPLIVAVKEPKPDEIATLKVSAVGYAFTLNYKYLSLAQTTISISTAIINALATDSEFVAVGYIEENTVEVQPPDTKTKVWDWLVELAEIGDGSSPYWIQVVSTRKLFYKKMLPTPTIIWNGTRLTTASGRSLTQGKWSARPGILRDLTWENVPLASERFLLNQRDSFVSEVESSVEYNIPLLKSDDQPDSDMIVALTRALTTM
jgi:hypothetical protein